MATVEFDHHSADFARRWRTIAANMRETCPVARTDSHGGYWIITRYEDIVRAARDESTFSSDHDLTGERNGYGGILIPPGPTRAIPMEMDPPEFLPYRHLLNPAFSPPTVERWMPRIRALTTEHIDRVIGSGRINLVADLGTPIPAIVTMEFLGLPTEDAARYAHLVHEFTYTPPHAPNFAQMQQEFAAMGGSVFAAAAARRADPREDLLSLLVNAELNNAKLSDEDIVNIGIFIVSAGTDTTTSLFSNAAWYLHENHVARQRLIEDPDLLPTATEEFLRYFTPAPAAARTVTRDIEFAGHSMKAGDRVLLLWSSANQDETEFPDPDNVMLDRHPNRHTAFSVGIHRCLGSNFARALFQEMLRQLLQRMPDYQIVEDEAERYPSIGLINGWIELPATFTPGSAGPSSP